MAGQPRGAVRERQPRHRLEEALAQNPLCVVKQNGKKLVRFE